jgi:hypothetical protein
MRTNQSIFAVAVMAAVTSCGGQSDSVGTFVNSCSDGTLMGSGSFACVDFGDGFTAGSCHGSGFTVVSSVPCPTANRVGHCIYVSDIGEHTVERWNWYAPSTRDVARAYCEMAGAPGSGRVSATFFPD